MGGDFSNALLPLSGIRIQLSGSEPENATPQEKADLQEFVALLVEQILKQGGTFIFGCHPTLMPSVEKAARPFAADGRREQVVLACSAEHFDPAKTEWTERQTWAKVEVLPTKQGSPNENLIPMREWMADRSDVIVAVGGKWSDTDPARAGVPQELQAMADRGKPAFLLTRFGGSTRALAESKPDIYSSLRNGLDDEENRQLSTSTSTSDQVGRILGQIKLLPIGKPEYKGGRRFRILALDGGGMRGVFTSAVLSRLASLPNCGGGRDLIEHFDLIAGTSTGGIVALGLALGKTPQDMLDFYLNRGSKIFPKRTILSQLFKPKHDAAVLEKHLRDVFKDSRLGQSKVRLVIPTTKAEAGAAWAITTPHHLKRAEFEEFPFVEAALATSAAPTFFKAAGHETDIAKSYFFDGGMWANNPVMPAIAEAVSVLSTPVDRIEILSIGTLSYANSFEKVYEKGLFGWAIPVSKLFMDAQQSGSDFVARTMLSDARILRITRNLNHVIGLDKADPATLNELARIGEEEGRTNEDEVAARFLDGYHARPWR